MLGLILFLRYQCWWYKLGRTLIQAKFCYVLHVHDFNHYENFLTFPSSSCCEFTFEIQNIRRHLRHFLAGTRAIKFSKLRPIENWNKKNRIFFHFMNFWLKLNSVLIFEAAAASPGITSNSFLKFPLVVNH